MIAEVHPEGAIDVDADNRERDAGCAVEPRNEGEQREDMIGSDGCDISPVDMALARAKRKWQRRFVGRDEGNSGVKFVFQQVFPTNRHLLYTIIRKPGAGSLQKFAGTDSFLSDSAVSSLDDAATRTHPEVLT